MMRDRRGETKIVTTEHTEVQGHMFQISPVNLCESLCPLWFKLLTLCA